MKRINVNLKKKGVCMLTIFIVVIFLFWVLFIRQREGFLEGIAKKSDLQRTAGTAAQKNTEKPTPVITVAKAKALEKKIIR
jgi:hypothetical protein